MPPDIAEKRKHQTLRVNALLVRQEAHRPRGTRDWAFRANSSMKDGCMSYTEAAECVQSVRWKSCKRVLNDLRAGPRVAYGVSVHCCFLVNLVDDGAARV